MEIKAKLPLDVALNREPYLLANVKGVQVYIPSSLVPREHGVHHIPFSTLLVLMVFEIPLGGPSAKGFVQGWERTVGAPEAGWGRDPGSVDFRLLPAGEWMQRRFFEVEKGDAVRINLQESPQDFVEGVVSATSLRDITIESSAGRRTVSRTWWNSSKSDPQVRFIKEGETIEVYTSSTRLGIFTKP